MRRVTADPFRILLAINYIGKNGPVRRDDVIRYLNEFSEKKGEKNSKSQGGAASDVLFNLKELRL
ncbi:hypothetical protein, partial [Methanocalculus sp.]|uniref:hypothetical protein n=1 Tax=Methanocalculus sp. TaxID=2004547 RepID=UPI00263077AE